MSQQSTQRIKQVLTRSCLDDKLWRRCLLLLSKICKARAIIPSSYLLSAELIRVGRVYYHGGFADVSNGEYLGCPVAIKHLRMNGESSDRVFKVVSTALLYHHNPLLSFTQGLCREIIGWKHLSHPNILPLLGVSVSTDPYSFRIITKWMPNESVTRYARSNPKVNRLRLVYPITVPHKLYFIHCQPLAVRGCIWCDVPS